MIKQPLIEPISDSLYRLTYSYTYTWSDGDCSYRVTIPANFTYDGASVPQSLWSLCGLTKDGLIRAAALVHDWIYSFGGSMPKDSYQQFNPILHDWVTIDSPISRAKADGLFKQIMKEAQMPSKKINMAYMAVRLFGSKHWGKN